MPPGCTHINIKYHTNYEILLQNFIKIIIALVDVLAHLQWVGFFSFSPPFYDRDYFNQVVIHFSLLC